MRSVKVMTETLISSSVLIILVIILRYILRRKIPNCLIYSLWLIVAVRLIMPSGISESALSVMNFQKYEQSSAITTGVPDIISENNAPECIKTNTAVPDIAETHHKTDTLNLHNIFNVIRITGTFILFIWFFTINLTFYIRMRRKRIKYETDCEISVYIVESLNSPCIFGIFRPSIYLGKPTTERLEYIISHELCHYRHGDLIWSILRCVLLSIWWFNPLVWVGAYLSKQDCEYACDESVMKNLSRKQCIEYGRVLLSFAGEHSENMYSITSSITSKGKYLKKRIVLITEKPKKSITACVIAVILTFMTVVCTFTSAETSHEISMPENNTHEIHIREPTEKEYQPEEVNDNIVTNDEKNEYVWTATDLYFYAENIYFGIVEKGDYFNTDSNILFQDNDILYEKVSDNNISTMKDLKKFVRNYFSEPLASQYNSMIEQNYIEHDGKLYQRITESENRAGAFSVEFLSKSGDTVYFNALHDDPYDTNKKEIYVRFFSMTYENEKWKISDFYV